MSLNLPKQVDAVLSGKSTVNREIDILMSSSKMDLQHWATFGLRTYLSEAVRKEETRRRIAQYVLDDERAERRAASRRSRAEYLKTPDGIREKRELDAACEEASFEASKQHAQEIRDIFRKYENSVKLRITKELLSQTFALPDGSRVFWGTATVEQHELKRDMLEKQALSTIETASQHQAAISSIREAGVSCLNEL